MSGHLQQLHRPPRPTSVIFLVGLKVHRRIKIEAEQTTHPGVVADAHQLSMETEQGHVQHASSGAGLGVLSPNNKGREVLVLVAVLVADDVLRGEKDQADVVVEAVVEVRSESLVGVGEGKQVMAVGRRMKSVSHTWMQIQTRHRTTYS